MMLDGLHHSKACVRVISRKNDYLNQGAVVPTQVIKRKKPSYEGKRDAGFKRVFQIFLLIPPVLIFAVIAKDFVRSSKVKERTRGDPDNQTVL